MDDLERYLVATGDAPAIIEYLASKFMDGGDEGRKARAVAQVEQLSRDLERALKALKGDS